MPAVVLVHGSGPLSRQGVMWGQLGFGFGFGFPVYADLARTLANRGYAVYRYDKRTCGRFNDCSDNDYPEISYADFATEYSVFEFLKDAEAAVAAVSVHPEIDRERVFALGHSQGGSLVPLLMTDLPQVRAGVMLTPPFRPLPALLEAQSERVRWSFITAGKPELAEREYAALAEAAHALHHVEAGTHLGAPILGQPPGLWASWIRLSHEAPVQASQLDRRLLVVGGEYDYNVPVSDIESWGQLLRASPTVAHRVLLLPCVTHALNCITQPDPTRVQSSDIGHEVAPALVDAVANFLDAG